MRVRDARWSDCLAIAEVHAASWRVAYKGALSDEYLAGDLVADRRQLWESRLSEPPKQQHVFVAEQSDQLVGFACAYGKESTEWGTFLNNIHVTPTVQGRGVGTVLLHATAERCVSLYGQVGLYLWVLQSNTKAQRFYARHGARIRGTDVWHAPGGTEAPLFRFAWESPRQLLEATAMHLAGRPVPSLDVRIS
jgi:ribosomal protein S18 acetylase RimI-like enzyme